MVETQLAARGLPILVFEAMRTVPRHLFIPEETQAYAYRDHPVPIGLRTMSQPLIVAFMTQALDPKPTDRVLEIGTGSGYQTAVLAEIVRHVYSIEIIEPLGRRARKILKEQGYKNVSTKIGDGYAGWSDAAPFDAIMLTAAPPELPQPLLQQLAVGGALIAPVGRGVQDLVVVRRTSGFTREKVMVSVVPMTGRAQRSPSK